MVKKDELQVSRSRSRASSDSLISLDDWKKIGNFDAESVRQWEGKGIDIKKAKKWINYLKKSGLELGPTDLEKVCCLNQEYGSPDKFLKSLYTYLGPERKINSVPFFCLWGEFNKNLIITSSPRKKKIFGILQKKTKGKRKQESTELLIFKDNKKEPHRIKIDPKKNNPGYLLNRIMDSFEGDMPALDLIDNGIEITDIVEKKEIEADKIPKNISEYDVIGVGENYNPIAIYLGSKQVAYVVVDGSERRISKSVWNDFLIHHQELKNKKLIVYHPIVPFKSSELIERHINIAIDAIGDSEHGFFGKDGEYFATLCTVSIKNVNSSSKKETRKEIERNNKEFEELIKLINKKPKELLKQKGYSNSRIEKIEEWGLKLTDYQFPDLQSSERAGVVKMLNVDGIERGHCNDLIILLRPFGTRQTNRTVIDSSNLGRLEKHLQIDYPMGIAENTKSSSSRIIKSVIKDFIQNWDITNEWSQDILVLFPNEKSIGSNMERSFSATSTDSVETVGHQEGTSADSAVYLTLLSAYSKKPISKEVAVTGTIRKLKDKPVSEWEIKPVDGVVAKAKAAMEKGARIIILPEGNKSEYILRVPYNVASNIEAFFIQKVADLNGFLINKQNELVQKLQSQQQTQILQQNPPKNS